MRSLIYQLVTLEAAHSDCWSVWSRLACDRQSPAMVSSLSFSKLFLAVHSQMVPCNKKYATSGYLSDLVMPLSTKKSSSFHYIREWLFFVFCTLPMDFPNSCFFSILLPCCLQPFFLVVNNDMCNMSINTYEYVIAQKTGSGRKETMIASKAEKKGHEFVYVVSWAVM